MFNKIFKQNIKDYKAKDLMIKHVITLSLQESLWNAQNMMSSYNIKKIVIVKESKKHPIGIISLKDMIRFVISDNVFVSHLNECFLTLEENRKKQKLEGSRSATKEQAKRHIDSLDYNLVQDTRELKKKYHSLIERHTWICNEIINTVYPEFIREEVEKIAKNKKTRYKKYPKHQRIFSSDAIEFRDSAKVGQYTLIK